MVLAGPRPDLLHVLHGCRSTAPCCPPHNLHLAPPCPPARLCRCSGYVVKARFQQDVAAAKVFDLSKSRELRVRNV